MENAKHIGGMWALALALGLGMGVANSPAVAWAAPADSEKGSSAESSSGPSSGKPSEKPSAKKGESSTTNAGPKRHRPKVADAASNSDDASSTTKKPRTDSKPRNEEQKRDATTSHPVSNSAAVTTRPAPAVVSVAASPTAVAHTAAPSSSAPAHPASPVQPAAFALLAFARREFEQIASIPQRMADRPAATVTTSAVDPDFISSTHGFFGLFSVTSAADPDDDHYVAFVLRTPFFTNVLTSGTDPEDNLGFGAASIGVAGHTVNTFISPFFTFSVGIPITDPFAVLFTELVRLGF
jgi:hypothetical protein